LFVAVIVYENGTQAWPVGVVELVMTGAGGLIVNVSALDVPPPGEGFTTVIDAVPGVATFAAGTMAVICVGETNVAVRVEPFQFTVELEMKVPLVSFTVKVNWPLPAIVEVGLIEVILGFGFAAAALLTTSSTRTSGKRRFMD
jgi:hypothetical protein